MRALILEAFWVRVKTVNNRMEDVNISEISFYYESAIRVPIVSLHVSFQDACAQQRSKT